MVTLCDFGLVITWCVTLDIYIYIYIKEISYTIGNITIIIYIIFKINCFMFVFKILTITIKPDIFYIFKNLIKIED
jgi:hypothetical protein